MISLHHQQQQDQLRQLRQRRRQEQQQICQDLPLAGELHRTFNTCAELDNHSCSQFNSRSNSSGRPTSTDDNVSKSVNTITKKDNKVNSTSSNNINSNEVPVHELKSDVNVEALTPKEACCICGGGTHSRTNNLKVNTYEYSNTYKNDSTYGKDKEQHQHQFQFQHHHEREHYEHHYQQQFQYQYQSSRLLQQNSTEVLLLFTYGIVGLIVLLIIATLISKCKQISREREEERIMRERRDADIANGIFGEENFEDHDISVFGVTGRNAEDLRNERRQLIRKSIIHKCVIAREEESLNDAENGSGSQKIILPHEETLMKRELSKQSFNIVSISEDMMHDWSNFELTDNELDPMFDSSGIESGSVPSSVADGDVEADGDDDLDYSSSSGAYSGSGGDTDTDDDINGNADGITNTNADGITNANADGITNANADSGVANTDGNTDISVANADSNADSGVDNAIANDTTMQTSNISIRDYTSTTSRSRHSRSISTQATYDLSGKNKNIRKTNIYCRPGVGSLPSRDSAASLYSPAVCPICIESYKIGDEIAWSYNEKCFHAFHLECITDWLMKNDECPMCRLNYLNIDENQEV